MIYMLSCHKCRFLFDAALASWCNCPSATASLRCAKCGACFCSAPAPYRRKAWTEAPRELRESPRRFRMPAEPAVAPVTKLTGRRPTVVIVDDDEAMRSFVACVIENLGYHTIVCGDPHEALDVVASGTVDVVLTDALMPKMDGRELCRLIKQRHSLATKVIVMTSLYRNRLFRNEAIDHFGADEFMTKPLDFDRLGRILAELTAREAIAAHG